MEGKIIAAYQTPHGVCYINDAAYAGKTPEQLQEVRREISLTVRSILERTVAEGGERYERLLEQIGRRERGEIVPTAVPIPIPEEAAAYEL